MARDKNEKVVQQTSEDLIQWLRSCRVTLALTCITAVSLSYLQRINLSVAIVCMVKVPENNFSSMDENASNFGNVSDDVTKCGVLEETSAHSTGEFEWSKQLRGYILSSLFYGYFLTQIPGGWLASRFGGKHVLGTGLLATAIANVLLPFAARTSVYFVTALRVVMGLGQGVAFPAIHNLWGRWAPPLERSRLVAFTYSGTTIGTVLAMSTSGFLCESKIDNGWPLIFYTSAWFANYFDPINSRMALASAHFSVDICSTLLATFGRRAGTLGIVFWIFWNLLVFNTPNQHPRITPFERTYICDAIGSNVFSEDKSTPWRAMMASPAVWALIIMHTLNNWFAYTLLTNAPSYLADVHKFDIKQNGLLSALPFVIMFIATIGVSYLADLLQTKHILSTVATRKTCQSIACTGAAVMLVVMGYMSCEQRHIAVIFLCVGVTFTSFGRSGYSVNHLDVAPKYAGIIYGMSNAAATIPGMVAPSVAGALTKNGTQGEWQIVFAITAALYMFGGLLFLVFARGTQQPWAKGSTVIAHTDKELGDIQS